MNSEKILTLAHEMRHAWQYKNRFKYGYKFGRSAIMYWLTYFFSKKEQDANAFAIGYGKRMGLVEDVLLYARSQKLNQILKVVLSICLCLIVFLTIFILNEM